MNSDLPAAQLLIDAAMQALQKGDRRTAYHAAEQAAQLAPHLEQPWLLLAFLASPKAAEYYLDRALQVNPTSQRALAGKEWLKKNSVQSAPLAGSHQPDSIAPTKQRMPTSTLRAWRRYLVWLGVLALALFAGLAAQNSTARMADNQDATLVKMVQTALQAGATAEYSPTAKPSPTDTQTETSTSTATATRTKSATVTSTASSTPTVTASSTPTSTASPMPTYTSQPTAKPTEKPLPSPTRPKSTPVGNSYYTVAAGDTLNIIAQRFNVSLQDLIAANNIANSSLIRAGQVLTIPRSGLPPADSKPTAASIPPGTGGRGKEILIDISEQHLYAYQDKELVFSFVVSTGIGNSTRIGTFKVLDKIPRAYSNAFNIWMPYWLGIYYSGTLENGIHGLPLLMNGVELWGNLLGRPATYGCIESRTADIKRLFDWAEIGTAVIIRN